MLPPIESDELLVAHGLYQQYRDQERTEIHELWTLHSLPDGATIWRSQLLYLNIPLSACYLLRDPTSLPVQMVFFWRWQDGREDYIEYRFMPGYVTVIHQDEEENHILPAHYGVYGWHTITEHFVWLDYDRTKSSPQTLRLVKPGIQDNTLRPTVTALEAAYNGTEIQPGPNGPVTVQVYTISEPFIGEQILRIDEFGIPLKWELEAEKLAVALDEYHQAES